MAVTLNRSVRNYLRRKKMIPVASDPLPTYEMGTLHPHDRPVSLAPYLRPVDSPANKVTTEET